LNNLKMMTSIITSKTVAQKIVERSKIGIAIM
jgi:hypothetical protein